MLTDEELNKISERVKNAGQYTWTPQIEGRDFTSGSSFIMTTRQNTRGEDIDISGLDGAGIDFVAHAKQDIPKLLDEINRLRSILNKK